VAADPRGEGVVGIEGEAGHGSSGAGAPKRRENSRPDG
jgi:hypothetical protein